MSPYPLLVFFYLLLFGWLHPAEAQPYVEGGNTRHRFAQLNIGSDNRVFLPRGTEWYTVNANGQPERRALDTRAESRLIVGGTHFWGHCDFYLATPVFSFGEAAFSTGSESVFQFFPWRIEHRKLRPYVGVSWLTAYYKQADGVRLKRFRLPMLTGAVYNLGPHLFEMGLGYNYNNRLLYYTTPAITTTVRTPPFWLSFCYKWMIETTLNREKDWKSGRTAMLTDSLARARRLGGFTLGIGPSEAVFLKRSPHNETAAPYLDQHVTTAVFPDLGIGYYFGRPDIQLHLAYRGYSNRLSAYGYNQTATRQALTLEGFRFWIDYHGFAAFAGPALSYEWLRVRDTDASGRVVSGQNEGLKPGLTFGWDIRPDRLQSTYLRTTLRYFPRLAVSMPGGKQFHFDALELNFIQLVIFPGRMFKRRLTG